jgi:hypothetical protein
LARLGAGAFETITGEVVNAILLTVTRAKPADDQMLSGLDASTPKTPEEKASMLNRGDVVQMGQRAQLSNPDARVALEDVSTGQLWQLIVTLTLALAPVMHRTTPGAGGS